MALKAVRNTECEEYLFPEEMTSEQKMKSAELDYFFEKTEIAFVDFQLKKMRNDFKKTQGG